MSFEEFYRKWFNDINDKYTIPNEYLFLTIRGGIYAVIREKCDIYKLINGITGKKIKMATLHEINNELKNIKYVRYI